MRVLIILVTAGMLLVATSLWKVRSTYHIQGNANPTQEPREDPTSLRARLKKAKPNENNEVVFGTPEPILADVSSLDEAVANYSIIIARPVDAVSIQTDSRNITTYYRFHLIENLSQKHTPFSGIPDNIPAGLPSLKANEFYLIEGGGTVLIDGVKVTQKPNYQYSLSDKYLLFASSNYSQTMAIVNLGRSGIFRIDDKDDDTLQPFAGDLTAIARDLKERHANKISKLRLALKRE